MSFSDDTWGYDKTYQFREEISKLSKEIYILLQGFSSIDKACVEDLNLYENALYSRVERWLIIINQYNEEEYSKNYIMSYKFETWLYHYVGKSEDSQAKYDEELTISDMMMKAKNRDLFIQAVSKVRKSVNNLIAQAAELEKSKKVKKASRKQKQVVYPIVEIDNPSNCTLTANAIKVDGFIKQYQPGSKIRVSLKGYNNDKVFGTINASEVDSFYKTLKFMICLP